MKSSEQISRCRQGLGEDLGELQSAIDQIQRSSFLVRASLYWRERQCGKEGCRCRQGKLHRSRAISVRRDGQSRVISLRGIDLLKVSAGIEHYHRFREKSLEIKRLRERRETNTSINFPDWSDCVVPISMERVPFDVHFFQLRV